jgi:hypothetical protein
VRRCAATDAKLKLEEFEESTLADPRLTGYGVARVERARPNTAIKVVVEIDEQGFPEDVTPPSCLWTERERVSHAFRHHVLRA